MKKILALSALLLATSSVNAGIVSFNVESQTDSLLSLALTVDSFGDTGLNGGTFSFDFDPTILQFTDGSIDAKWNFPSNSVGRDIDNALGTVGNGIFSTFFTTGITSGIGDDSSYLVGLFNFDIVGAGTTMVNLTSGIGAWSDPVGGTITTLDFQGVQVQVSAVPVPAAAWLMLSGLGALLVTGRKKTLK